MMQSLAILTVALLGAASAQYQYGAPPDAVQKATEQFHRLYNKAAALAEAAPDTDVHYPSQQCQTSTQYQTPVATYHPTPANYLAGPPSPVKDTPEVAAARAAFHRQYQQLAQQAADAPDTHQYTQQSARYTYTPYGAPRQVQDTPEVRAAKSAFQREFQRRAALAASAAQSHTYAGHY